MSTLCFVTGTRAEFGLLLPLMQLIREDARFQLRLVVTGAHLSPEFGLTVREIEESSIPIDERIEIVLSSDSAVGVSKSMGLALIGLAEAYARLKPDMVVLLGDRYEAFCAAAAAVVARLPIAHLHGGELTEGAVDDVMRHAITKMSYLHFTATERYRQRVIQLGEDPARVHTVGAIGLDGLSRMAFLSRQELERRLGIRFRQRNLLVTFHPPTLDAESVQEQMDALLAELELLRDTALIFTKANADAGGRAVNAAISSFAAGHRESVYFFESLGRQAYLSVMKEVDGVVGNSSSGIIEAPSLGVGTVNIGDRQRGRVTAESTICCDTRQADIQAALRQLYSPAFRERLPHTHNPYGDGTAARGILAVLRNFQIPPAPVKQFYDFPEAGARR